MLLRLLNLEYIPTPVEDLASVINIGMWVSSPLARAVTSVSIPNIIRVSLKGVLHPRPVFWLFMHFSQELQHIGDKLDMFLLGNILGNLITAPEFTNSSGYWFMVQNMQNIDFRTFFTITSQQWLLLK